MLIAVDEFFVLLKLRKKKRQRVVEKGVLNEIIKSEVLKTLANMQMENLWPLFLVLHNVTASLA